MTARRKVALKVLKPELAAVLGAERFVQEITTTAALQHPHILPLFDSGTAEGFLYLYEMLAGQPPHLGGSAQQIIMKIIAEPVAAVTTLRKSVPLHVAAAIAKALEKLPADRFGSAAEFAAALQNPSFAATVGTTATHRAVAPARSRAVAALALTSVAFGALAVWALLKAAPEPEAKPVHFTVPVSPFFSPDGQWIAFTQGDAIRRMSINGGPASRVASAALLGASWSEDGSIVSTTRGALWRTPVSGGTPERITTVEAGESEHVWPQSVGRYVLIFTSLGNTGIATDAKVIAMDLRSGRRVVVREQATYGRFVSPGHIAYIDVTGTLSAIGFDLERLATVGEPFALEAGIQIAWWGGGASFAVSATGTLAFVRGSTFASLLVWWVDRAGHRQVLGEPMSPATLALAPDGRRILVDPPTPSALEIWLMDAATGVRDRVTFAKPGTISYESPTWSPDGKQFATAHQVADSMRIEVRGLEGNEPRPLVTLFHHHHVQHWSPDGRWLLLTEEHPERSSDLLAIRIDRVQERVVVAETPATEWSGRFSPDGRWVAYQSNESGRDEVYVVSFPSADVRHQVSSSGGRWPRWSRESGELFFWQDAELLATRVSTAGVFRRATPTRQPGRSTSCSTGTRSFGRATPAKASLNLAFGHSTDRSSGAERTRSGDPGSNCTPLAGHCRDAAPAAKGNGSGSLLPCLLLSESLAPCSWPASPWSICSISRRRRSTLVATKHISPCRPTPSRPRVPTCGAMSSRSSSISQTPGGSRSRWSGATPGTNPSCSTSPRPP